MESPFNRPKAANLIRIALVDHEMYIEDNPEFCGFSREMMIYTALKAKGYLTEEAMKPDDK